MPLGFSLLDLIALLCFFGLWIGYTIIVDFTRLSSRNITTYMRHFREVWMQRMLQRDHHVADAGLQANLISGVAFFASTTIIAIGGVLALLGSGEKGVLLLASLPFATETTQPQWQIKVLLLAMIFVYAFFKFTWALRLYNYCSVLIGAAPYKPELDDEAKQYAARAVRINALAAAHFNRGIRAYFFAVASLGWFVHPALLIIATLFVIYVLLGREFRSQELFEDA